MQTSLTKRKAFRWLMFAALVVSLGAVLNASSCNSGGEFEQTLGGKIDARSNIERTTAGHKYVADMSKRLYWPNKPQYVKKIPEGSRGWILNDENLAKYKGYKPGSQ